jgi:purine-binding chemotaxis protein CheW
MERQLVIFELAGEHYGIDIARVESIIKMQPITTMLHAPSFVEGVTNLRGKVLPVIDLRRRFRLPGNPARADARIVVVSIDGNEVGMVVDAVSEVLTISDEAIEPPPALVTTLESSFITGIAKLDNRLVILLDLARVLSEQEQSQLENVK